jgi:hypothetical protein
MKIYISGPVRGKVDYAEDFFESEKMLKGEGHEVVNPIRLMDMLPKGLTDEEFLELDMMLLKHCDTIYLLPGWRADSRLYKLCRLWQGSRVRREVSEEGNKDCSHRKNPDRLLHE